MRRTIPPIKESTEVLEARCAEETDERKKQRLEVLYLLRSQTVRTMQDAAPLVHVHRVTVSRWLSVYEHGGIEALLSIPTVPGRPPLLSDDVIRQLSDHLKIPGYFRSYREIHTWLCTTFDCAIGYKAVHKIVRYVLKVQITGEHTATGETLA